MRESDNITVRFRALNDWDPSEQWTDRERSDDPAAAIKAIARSLWKFEEADAAWRQDGADLIVFLDAYTDAPREAEMSYLGGTFTITPEEFASGGADLVRKRVDAVHEQIQRIATKRDLKVLAVADYSKLWQERQKEQQRKAR